MDPSLQITFDDARAYVDRIKAQVDPVLPSHDLEPCVDIYLRYQELLRQTGSADFADLMLLAVRGMRDGRVPRSEEHTSELQSLMRISYAVFCLKKKKDTTSYTLIPT